MDALVAEFEMNWIVNKITTQGTKESLRKTKNRQSCDVDAFKKLNHLGHRVFTKESKNNHSDDADVLKKLNHSRLLK
jgi:hypothetical protein